MLTGEGDSRVDLEAMSAGAVEYLVKSDVSPVLLERSLRYAVERNRVVALLKHRGAALAESESEYRATFG